jgi:NTE family protein
MSFVSFVCGSSSARRRLAFALAGLWLLGGLASAEAPPERPKIGLALGGGGAKGGAHVGVLKVMEELNIPVDYVAGTSIGAIVGGLYASGMTADEMADALNSIDWDDVMRDEPPRKDLNFRRKEDDQRYRVKLQLGLKDWKVQWPAGVMTGQKLYFMLQALTIQVADVENFDRLPIPFRCVATDIQTGDPVVLGRGNLANAMRASMAIPVAFTPVELDGRTLVDGGITNNIPVDVVREMGADIVIAIDLGAPLTSRQVKSLLEIRSQMMRMLIRKNMEPQLENADLVINPEVSQYGTLDFSRIDENMKLGAEAAEAKRPELAKLAIAPEDYEKHRTRQRESRGETPTIDAIEFKGNQRVDDRIINHKVRLQAGDRFDFESLFDDISRIYGLGDFSQVFFAVREAGDGRVVLTIDMVEKPWGPNYLHFGLSASSDLQGDNRLAALVNLTNTRLNSLGAEVRSDFQLGTRSLIRS